jgi:hypothetical protein
MALRAASGEFEEIGRGLPRAELDDVPTPAIIQRNA